MNALADRLAARTLELVDIPSVSGSEDAIRRHLLSLVPSSLVADYEGDEVLFFCPVRRDVPLVVLAGHYDTVPEQGNLPGEIRDGAVHGLGASDMKGGVAVAVELVRDLERRARGQYDVGLVLFGREELPSEHNPLPALFTGSENIHDTTLAILLEPTDGRIQAGCLGNVVARIVFHGRSGHSARPWLADNAIERAVEGLSTLFRIPPRTALVGGLEFKEVVSVTRLESGIADNVIPGEASATVNLRYPPDRSPTEAESYIRALVPAGATLVISSNGVPGRVVTDSPLVEALRAAGDLEIEPKQAWTNVSDFTANDIDAVNFGPGHTALAHRQDEHVEIAALVHAYATLERFLFSPMKEDAA